MGTEPVTRAQAWLHFECQLLTRLRGRGFFYLYQGTLMVTQCVFCSVFLCGLWQVLMGFLCISTSFGFKPDIEYIAASAGLAGAEQRDLLDGSAEEGTAIGVAARHFPKAESAWKHNKEHLCGKASRELWALHKQATVGNCNTPKPEGMFNGNAKE